MGFKFGKASLKKMEGVFPPLVECAIETLAQSRYDMTIPWLGGVRTAEQQNDCYKRKASKLDGYNKLSYHQIEAAETGFGMALDIVPYYPGMSIEQLYECHKEMNYFARLMLINWQEKIYEDWQDGVMIWGGTFGATSWDRPHYEIRL